MKFMHSQQRGFTGRLQFTDRGGDHQVAQQAHLGVDSRLHVYVLPEQIIRSHELCRSFLAFICIGSLFRCR